MFDKIGRAAEKAAASVPRRHFLGRLARGAALVAGSLGGILLTAGPARAGGGGEKWCCLMPGESGGWWQPPPPCFKGMCSPLQTWNGKKTVRCSDWPDYCPL